MALTFILEVFTYLIFAVVFYLGIRMITRAYLKNGENKREASRRAEREQTILPLRLQACERLILLLERITPARAVNRALQPEMTTYELQMTLLRNIREEYEHNVAQQLYISPSCWSLIRTAKEEIIRLVNLSASETDNGSAAGEMAKNLLIYWSQLDQDPVQLAITQLKKEIEI
jgi:hypothetical protein